MAATVRPEPSPRRRILLSSYACSPHWGSEPGVGWRWLIELSNLHDIILVTHGYFREHLEPLLREKPLPGLKVHYYCPAAFGAHPHKQLNSRLFYVWWQWHVRRYVEALLKSESVDLIHHLTWGTMRFPTFLGNLGIPLVMGPVGGGEVAPMRLFKGLPWWERAFEWFRSASLAWSRIDPLALLGPSASFLILCKTADTVRALPPRLQSRCVVAPEIGAPPVDLSCRESVESRPRSFRLLFAARLVGWKGALLALNSLQLLVNAGYDVTLDIAGDGPMHKRLARQIDRLHLAGRACLLGKLSRDSLLDLYGSADLFIFPSLHDSSGNVVLEALSRGLPVVCLDLGGPKHYVTADCGVVISTHNRTRTEVEQAMANAISTILDNPDRLRAMVECAAAQAAEQTWERRVGAAYALIARRLNWSS